MARKDSRDNLIDSLRRAMERESRESRTVKEAQAAERRRKIRESFEKAVVENGEALRRLAERDRDE